MLIRLSGRRSLSPSDPAVQELTRLCGCLPLAIGMVARQLHHHPSWSLAGRAGELASARDRLELIATENLSVAAAFNLSYEDLSEDQQRLFRRLGLHLGTDIDVYAAAALDGTDLSAAGRRLEALYDQYLLTELAPGRYRLHDLIREHARVIVGRLDPDSDHATARLMDYYQFTAGAAEALLTRQSRPAPIQSAARPPAVPVLAGREQALAWARTERASLLACLDWAVVAGQHARVIALTAGLAGLLRQDGPWAEAITRHTIALRSARHLSDRLGEANALNDLGIVRRLAGDCPGATQYLAEALGIYRVIGDRLGQANALTNLGDARRLTGDYPGSAEALAEALDIYRDLGDWLGQANVLLALGNVRLVTGDYPGAVSPLEEALGVYRDLGNRLGQANVLNDLGTVRRLAGDYPGAAQAHLEALSIHRDLSNRRGQANALLALGSVRRVTKDYPGAAKALDETPAIYRDIGDRGGEATALNEVGTLHWVLGDVREAGSSHQQALGLASEIGSSWDQAHALAGLGRCAHAIGRTAEARDQTEKALKIFQRIGATEAADVAAELAELTNTELT